ncbi:TPA: hypothetical protein ACIN54_000442 [Streptococcus agalactiae]|uniref:hypothetical protein n=1 Tax=Streptococcus TaxID=1301 RepID=UPI0002B9DE3E|nr:MULTISPECIES: hypothetical protein [Streptococcus]EPV94119.1 hypothetical protein SAG0038_02285 [Streptococcus agalactiae FSL S3-090]EPX36988.1 hypothetical protein SAG0342_02045 [Streptococcus agalactiae GB00867]MCW1393147.1 hypothetical protein [Streptococcus agalactiae]MCW1440660.1 hypothetical protein [Streptococcus agalactiae]MCW1811232.1 hypothetical protein [Streptococcus agalactiae]
MARKKYIDNQELLLLFEHYLLEHCSNNPRLFKIPQFGNYLRNNGFPQVADTTIRRNKEFRQALNDKLELFEDDTYQTVITYKTLDVERFLMTNRTPKAIKTALVELNGHYKRIVDAAIAYKNEVESLKKRMEELKSELAQLKESKYVFDEQVRTNKELAEENKKLRNLLKTSLYPEIANELLKEEGLLKSDQQLVTKKYLSENIITSDSKISFEKHTHTEEQTSKSKILEIKDLLDNKTKY